MEVCCEGGYMDFIRDVLKGAVIAIAGIVPGVSGGTMMVSMGIYDDVIHAVTGFFAHWKKCEGAVSAGGGDGAGTSRIFPCD